MRVPSVPFGWAAAACRPRALSCLPSRPWCPPASWRHSHFSSSSSFLCCFLLIFCFSYVFFFTVLFLVAHDVQWPLEAFDRDEQPNVPQVLLSAMQRSDPALQGSGTFFICIFSFFFFWREMFPIWVLFLFFQKIIFCFHLFLSSGKIDYLQ